jgi:protein phosphatase
MDLVQISTPQYINGYVESRIGGRSENQDSFGCSETPFGFLVTVCDGMGGGPGGKTASSIAVKEIIRGVIEGNKEEALTNIIIKAIRRANLAVITRGQEIPELRGMGSTCTVLLINEDSAIIAHVGDSRVYQLRGKTKVFRTFDHSMVFGLVQQGVITEEQARLSAQSNVITRALGINPDIEVDITTRPYLAGDRFLLCTDGIHGSLPEAELIGFVADKKQPIGVITDNIATTIDGKGRQEGGGHDNLTLAIIEPNINSKLKETMNKTAKILLIALGIVCIVSLLLNFIAFYRKTPTDNELQVRVTQLDSINRRLNDSIAVLSTDVKKLQVDSTKRQATISALNQKIEKLKKNLKQTSSKDGQIKK